jgi:hypothetical protein
VGGIRAHVCANDDMALGALVALKSRNLVGKVALSMRWSRHWPRNTPISISTMFSQLRVDVDHDLPQLAAVRSRKGHAVHRRKLLAQVVDPIIVELLLAEAVGGQAELQHRNARGRCTPRRSVARCRPASGRGLNRPGDDLRDGEVEIDVGLKVNLLYHDAVEGLRLHVSDARYIRS